MKSLSLIIFAILSCVASLALGELDIFYQDIDATAAPPAPLPPAAMRVVGEIRSVDENKQPRLWGEGRPGTVRYGRLGIETYLCVNGDVEFGLTYAVTEWETTPSVCPVGTWVCTLEDISGTVCNTARPDDDSIDYLNCEGGFGNWLEGHHFGWVADTSEDGLNSGGVYPESDVGYRWQGSCYEFPVWCCSEYQP